MKDHVIHECDTASIWLPKGMRIQQPLPGLFAKQQKMLIAIVLMPADVLCDSFRELLDSPLIQTRSECQLELVRRGTVESPYTGNERIVQANYHSLDEYDYRWELLLEDGERRATFTIGGPGRFVDSEEKWTKVVDSFRFK